jgi:hypothetical protein
VVSFIPQPLCPWRKNPQCSLDRRHGVRGGETLITAIFETYKYNLRAVRIVRNL